MPSELHDPNALADVKSDESSSALVAVPKNLAGVLLNECTPLLVPWIECARNRLDADVFLLELVAPACALRLPVVSRSSFRLLLRPDTDSMGCLPPWSSTLLISATNFSSLSPLMHLTPASKSCRRFTTLDAAIRASLLKRAWSRPPTHLHEEEAEFTQRRNSSTHDACQQCSSSCLANGLCHEGSKQMDAAGADMDTCLIRLLMTMIFPFKTAGCFNVAREPVL